MTETVTRSCSSPFPPEVDADMQALLDRFSGPDLNSRTNETSQLRTNETSQLGSGDRDRHVERAARTTTGSSSTSGGSRSGSAIRRINGAGYGGLHPPLPAEHTQPASMPLLTAKSQGYSLSQWKEVQYLIDKRFSPLTNHLGVPGV